MFKYLFLCFSLFAPIKIPALRNPHLSSSHTGQLVAMVPPPPGDIPSKMANSAATPGEGCRVTSQTTYHSNGSSTTTDTITCSKKTKKNSKGEVVKKSNLSSGKYKAAQNDFFGPKSGSSSSKKK